MDVKEFIAIQGQNFRRHPWEIVRSKVLTFWVSKSKQQGKIVDIGSGDAFLADSIAQHYKSSEVYAVDSSYNDKTLTGISKNKSSNLHFYNKLSSASTHYGSINIVVMMDILEHIEHPEMLLKEVLALPGINQDTTILITLPAYQFLFSQHDKNLGHFKRYNIKVARKMLPEELFRVKYSGYFFNSLLLVRVFEVLKEKITRNKNINGNSISTWKRRKWITRLISSLLWVEFKISWYLARMGIKLPGLTCYIICHPSQ